MYAELDTLGKRVKYFREQKKLSQAQLANMVLSKDKNTGELRPIDPSVIGNIENRDSKKSQHTAGLAKALGVSMEWLATGEGEPVQTAVRDEPKKDVVSEDSAFDYVVIGGSTDYPLVLVDYLDKKASCGGGYVNGEYEEKKGQIAFTVEFLRENKLPIDGDGLVLMHACGDSMGYTIPDETMMLVNRKECHFENMISKEVYTFNADGEMICKRAFKNLDGSITLVSDNTDKTRYPDQIVDKDKFNHFDIFGRVRYTFNKM